MNGTRWLRRLVLAHALLLCCCMARAQLKLGSNPAVISKSSILELESERQGLLLPRIPDTAVTTLATAPDGMIIYFTSDKSLRVRKGGYWIRLADAVNFWQNAGAAGGDLTGSYPAPSIAAGAVSYSKMQPVSATARLLGRYAAGSGTVQEITLGGGLSLCGAGELSATPTAGWILGGNSLTAVQKFGTISNHDLPVFTNNAERMRITAGGLVGINTTNPTSQLHVKTGTAGASGLRLENLTNTDVVTAAAAPIGVDANGNVVRAPSPVYYSGTGASASVGLVSKVWVAEVANISGGVQTINIPTNVGFTNILNIQVTAKGGTDATNAPIATIVSNSTSNITIRVVESNYTPIVLGLLGVEGLAAHSATTTRIYIRVEGN